MSYISTAFSKLGLALAVLFLVGVFAAPASAQPVTVPFDAEFTGEFTITGDIGGSPLFTVEEEGEGEDAGLGAFTFTTEVAQNLAHKPHECDGFNSSTGIRGVAVFSFPDGDMYLERTAGTSCFAFPLVSLDEKWIVTSGTGAYLGASGSIKREADGNVITGVVEGTWSGNVKLQ